MHQVLNIGYIKKLYFSYAQQLNYAQASNYLIISCTSKS